MLTDLRLEKASAAPFLEGKIGHLINHGELSIVHAREEFESVLSEPFFFEDHDVIHVKDQGLKEGDIIMLFSALNDWQNEWIILEEKIDDFTFTFWKDEYNEWSNEFRYYGHDEPNKYWDVRSRVKLINSAIHISGIQEIDEHYYTEEEVHFGHKDDHFYDPYFEMLGDRGC